MWIGCGSNRKQDWSECIPVGRMNTLVFVERELDKNKSGVNK